MKNILITGASGFLGSNLKSRLEKIYNCKLISKHGDLSKGIDKLDLSNHDAITKYLHEFVPNYIIHLASYVNLSRDISTSNKCFIDNAISTQNLLESCKLIPNIHFILASTEEVYGGNSIPFNESQLPDPPSPYSISKITAEHLCSYYSKLHGFKSLILRIGTMYGPNQQKEKYIPSVVIKALNNDDVLMNSGVKKRDYIFVGDVVDAIELSLRSDWPDGSTIINIGGGATVSLKDLAQKIIHECGSKSTVLMNSLPERNNERSEWLMDISKANKLLKWEPKTSLNYGVELMIKYFRNSLSK